MALHSPCFPDRLVNLPRPLVVLIVVLLYGTAVAAGLLVGRLSLDIGTVWLASGIGIVAVLVWGYWLLPLIAVVHIGVSLAVGVLPFLPRLGMGLVATAEIGLAAWWLSCGQGRGALRFDLPGTARFALTCLLLVPLGGALTVTGYLWLVGTIPAESMFVVARNWWFSVGLGMLTMVPLLTTWLVYGKPRLHLYRREALTVLAALMLPASLILTYQLDQRSLVEAFFYVSLPILLWASVFLRETGAATGLTLMTLLAIAISFWAPSEQLPIWSLGAHIFSFGLMALFMATAQSSLEQAVAERARQAELEQWAFQDSLTELANRHHLSLVIQEALRSWQQGGAPFAVLLMDLDGFKPINDAHGHDAGDAVLRIVAARLRSQHRPGDLLARMGGDEFVMVLRNCADLEQARAVGERLLCEVGRPMTLEADRGDQTEVTLGASIGISHVAHGAVEVKQLLKQADLALYRAKQAGKHRVETYRQTPSPNA